MSLYTYLYHYMSLYTYMYHYMPTTGSSSFVNCQGQYRYSLWRQRGFGKGDGEIYYDVVEYIILHPCICTLYSLYIDMHLTYVPSIMYSLDNRPTLTYVPSIMYSR